MGGLISAAQLIAALSLLVLIHEFGHFAAAKFFGMRCEKFYIFFDAWGKKLWSKKIGETEYGIGWLPLGGYVKISGMIDESMDKEAMKQEPQEWEFRSKPAWQRFIVMIGGIVMNLILGVIIFAGILKFGAKEYIKPAEMDSGVYAYKFAKTLGFQTGDKILTVDGKEVERFKDVRSPAIRFGADVGIERNGQKMTISVPDTLYNLREPLFGQIEESFVEEVRAGYPAEKAGLKEGDKLLSVNDVKVQNFMDFRYELMDKKGKTVNLLVEREGKPLQLTSQVDTSGIMGFTANSKAIEDAPRHPYSVGSSIKYGIKEGWETIYYNAKGMALIAMGKLPFLENVQSPIGIAKFYGPTWDWFRFWYLTGLISFVLAFMNILPIPALDGGHMVFLAYEMITRRKLSDNFLEKAQMVGMLILIPLMLLILGKDIWELIRGLF